jgi:glycosyltransferase involved in cell wall biosynthesis
MQVGGLEMQVGVIIPVHNRPKLVIEALESVINQTRVADHIIVIDDGSTDNTRRTLHNFTNSLALPKLQLLSLRHCGAPAARNFGLRQIPRQVEAVAFLDSDDLWPKDFLDRTIAALTRSPDAVAVSCDGKYYELDGGNSWQRDTRGLQESPWRHMIEYGGGIASCTLFRATAVREEGGFPEDFPTGHDNVLFSRLAQRGKWLHAPGVPVIFRRNYERTLPQENTHLHRAFSDYLARWAFTAELIYSSAPAEVQNDPFVKKTLRGKWVEAAKQALQNGNQRAALQYLVRGLVIDPVGQGPIQQANSKPMGLQKIR